MKAGANSVTRIPAGAALPPLSGRIWGAVAAAARLLVTYAAPSRRAGAAERWTRTLPTSAAYKWREAGVVGCAAQSATEITERRGQRLRSATHRPGTGGAGAGSDSDLEVPGPGSRSCLGQRC